MGNFIRMEMNSYLPQPLAPHLPVSVAFSLGLCYLYSETGDNRGIALAPATARGLLLPCPPPAS